MFKWLTKLIDSNEREINKLQTSVREINKLEPEFREMSDDDLAGVTAELRARLQDGDDLHDLLPEAFAAAREAARRTLGQRHYDVQLMGGMVLHQGRIAEMRTGEGKTLVATLPAYLNAIPGHGVHVVTVNDYLAKRDPQWMGPVFHALGMSVASIQHDAAFLFDPTYKVDDPRYNHLRPIARQDAYRADITYGTNNEFGFDFLRDNMVEDLSMMVQRPLNYAVVDEVDNILIDEARTPLIISGEADEPTTEYVRFAQLVPRLALEEDYKVDEKTRSVMLTEAGVARIERWLSLDNLYGPENYQKTHYVENALKAHAIFKRDRDYIVTDGEVVIVDEFTGRQMPGRRWSDGLHQAVEAKEGLNPRRESLTLATVTLQNYFRLYKKLSGMTGTAVTEAEEFHKIYKLEVVVVPTNRPTQRRDYPDQVFKNERAKFEAVVREVEEMHRTGRPVLVGTVSIEKSEYLSEMLRLKAVPHEVLNAKFHEREAEIVSQAGRFGGVTIATNMAGRGTDIVLGGNAEGLAQQEARRQDIGPEENPEEYQAILAKMKVFCAAERERVVAVGGLHIIGTERHEARRIDNQLRGRAGRQGDPGSSRFYVSLEDDIMRRFGGDRIKGFMEWAGIEDDVPIEHGLVTKSLETAQTKVESYNFDLRKHLVEYDDVMNSQRDMVYQQRRKLLEGADLKGNMKLFIVDELNDVLNRHLAGSDSFTWDLESLITELNTIMPLSPDMTIEGLARFSREEIVSGVIVHADEIYEMKEGELGSEGMRYLERVVMLRTIGNLWVDHLTAMDDMRQGIGLRAYGQSDPLVAYKREAHDMYDQLRQAIRHNIVRTVYHVTLTPVAPPAPPLPQETHTNREEDDDEGEPTPFGHQHQATAPMPPPKTMRLPAAPPAPAAPRAALPTAAQKVGR
ncbi:MAG: preprotein translocase subunit SecA, partial [Chloroflexi bacterium]|nr:preprotein translocase subunit SecA [Chloroflexota bacterium]